ncbi:RDD family protein, partial [Pseudidiomarina aestuarii]
MLASALALGFAALLTTFGWVTLTEGEDHAAWLNRSPLFGI